MEEYAIGKRGNEYYPLVRWYQPMWAFGDWRGSWKSLTYVFFEWQRRKGWVGGHETKESAISYIEQYKLYLKRQEEYREPEITITPYE